MNQDRKKFDRSELLKEYEELRDNYKILGFNLKKIKKDIDFLQKGGKIIIAVDTVELVLFMIASHSREKDSDISDMRYIIAGSYVFSQNRNKDSALFEDVFLPPPYLYELKDVWESYLRQLLKTVENGQIKLPNILSDIWKGFNRDERKLIIEARKSRNISDDTYKKYLRSIIDVLKSKFPVYYLILTRSMGTGTEIIRALFEKELIKTAEEMSENSLSESSIEDFNREIEHSYTDYLLHPPERVQNIINEFEKIPFRRDKYRSNLYDAVAIYLVCEFNKQYEDDNKMLKMVIFSDSPSMNNIEKNTLTAINDSADNDLFKYLSHLHVRDSYYFVTLLSMFGDSKGSSEISKNVERESIYVSQFEEWSTIFSELIEQTEEKQIEENEVLDKIKDYKQHYDNIMSLKLMKNRDILLSFYENLRPQSKKIVERHSINEKAEDYQILSSIFDFLTSKSIKDDVLGVINEKIKKSEEEIMEALNYIYEKVFTEETVRKLLERKSIKSIYIDFRRFRNMPWGIDFKNQDIKRLLDEFNMEVERALLSWKQKPQKNTLPNEIIETLMSLFRISYEAHKLQIQGKMDFESMPERLIVFPLILFGLGKYEEALNAVEYEKESLGSISENDDTSYSIAKMLFAVKLMAKGGVDTKYIRLCYNSVKETYKHLQEIGRSDDPRVIDLLVLARYNANLLHIDNSIKTNDLINDLEKTLVNISKENNKPIKLMLLNNILFLTVEELELLVGSKNLNVRFSKETMGERIKDIEDKLTALESEINEDKNKKETYLYTMYEILDTIIRTKYLLYLLKQIDMPKYNKIKFLCDILRQCQDLEIATEDLEISNRVKRTKDTICPNIKKEICEQ